MIVVAEFVAKNPHFRNTLIQTETLILPCKCLLDQGKDHDADHKVSYLNRLHFI